MSSTFLARMDLLEKIVGKRTLSGKVIVDQVYAQYQHEGLDLRHPRGGQAKYLEEPLFTERGAAMRRLARDPFKPLGLTQAMISNMEHLAGKVFELAPVEFGDLKGSGHPIVTDDGARVYDRPAVVHRLSKAELRSKGQLRREDR